jgi:hypothetical protein
MDWLTWIPVSIVLILSIFIMTLTWFLVFFNTRCFVYKDV